MTKVFLISLLLSPLLSASCLQLENNVEKGMCYEKEGNTNLAQASYEQAILENDQDTQAHLKLSNLYKNMQMPREANAVLADVDKAVLSPAQRTSLETFKKSKEVSLNTFKIRASLGLGYDSNININPNDTVIRDFNATTLEGSSSTLFTRARADMSYIYDIGGNGGFFLRSDANLYYQNNFDASFYNITYGRLYAGGGYKTGDLTFYIPIFYDRLHYLDADMLEESGVRPDLTYALSDTLYLNLHANYTKRHYFRAIDAQRDDEMMSGGGGIYWLKDGLFVYLKGRYENYTGTKTPVDIFTDRVFIYGSMGGIYTLDNIADFILDYQYRNSNFAEVQDLKRHDNMHNIKVALERELFYGLRANLSYHYINNSSSYDLATYDKHESILSLVYNY